MRPPESVCARDELVGGDLNSIAGHSNFVAGHSKSSSGLFKSSGGHFNSSSPLSNLVAAYLNLSGGFPDLLAAHLKLGSGHLKLGGGDLELVAAYRNGGVRRRIPDAAPDQAVKEFIHLLRRSRRMLLHPPHHQRNHGTGESVCDGGSFIRFDPVGTRQLRQPPLDASGKVSLQKFDCALELTGADQRCAKFLCVCAVLSASIGHSPW